MRVRNHLLWTAAITAGLLTSPVSAQKISLGGAVSGQFFTAANQVPAFDINVSQAETSGGGLLNPGKIVLGRADTSGSLDADVDLLIVDPESTHLSTDPSLFFDANQATMQIGSGTSINPGKAGTVHLRNGMGSTSISLFGASGNATQTIDASNPANGNGFIKAWAVMDGNGNVVRCWNCNTSSSQTQRLATGQFEVDFTLGDISTRAYLAVIGCATPTPPIFAVQCSMDDAIIEVGPRYQDASSVYVEINDLSGTLADRSFTVFVL